MNAEYSLRILIIPRTLTGVKLPSGEDEELWNDDTGKRYSAKRLALNAGEEIRQGVRESSDFMKLEIRGRNVPVEATSRVKLVHNGREYRITAEPIRERRVTILSIESR